MRSFFAFLLLLFVPLVLLPVIPVPGVPALVGGLVGGYVAGRPGRAFFLAVLPVLIVAVLALLVATGVGLPIVGAILAGFALIFFVAHSVALLVGAILGGFLGQSRQVAVA
jgi:hypothetical protein